jgi:pimeloyl-ACP methyl ester carboxylesterase
MAYFGITATAEGLKAATPGDDLEGGLRRRLAGVGPPKPIVVLIHGYKFHPALPDADPHRSLYAFNPQRNCWKIRSWPEGLGFSDDAGETGLCIGFGWPASVPHVPSLLATGRNGFARVYDRAGRYGARLAELVRLLQRLAPGRPIDLLAHSQGARVALAALPALEEAPDRVILLGAAEFGPRALGFLDAARGAPRPPSIYNVTTRANDLYDLAFESFAPRRGWGERALGAGLGARRPNWLDLQLDRSDVTAWVNAQGVALTERHALLCHWSFYTRDGALGLYQAILRRRPGWDIASLRAAPCFAEQEPRWSRLVPRRQVGMPTLAPKLEMDGSLEGA